MTKQTTAFTAISRTAISALLLCAVGIAATGCHPRPEITASSREEAMEKCLDDIDRELTVIKKERARAKADPESASFKTNENYYSDYQYTFLLDDEYDTIEITQAFASQAGTDITRTCGTTLATSNTSSVLLRRHSTEGQRWRW